MTPGPDAYYTRPHIARQAWAKALRYCRARGHDPAKLLWVEPSAGAGVFLDTKPRCVRDIMAFDIAPMASGIERRDFLHTFRWDFPAGRDLAFIGNPPFGRQARLVRDFVNHAITELQAVFCTFITPGFVRPAAMRNRPHGMVKIAARTRLGGDCFHHPDGKPFDCNSNIITFARDGERFVNPPREHPDFYIRANSNRDGKDPRRGRGGRSHRGETLAWMNRHPPHCIVIMNSKPQVHPPEFIHRVHTDEWKGKGDFMLVCPRKFSAAETARRMRAIDWAVLLREASADGKLIPHIGVRDVVAAYTRMFGDGHA